MNDCIDSDESPCDMTEPDTDEPLTFVEQVEELRYLGYNDLQIAAQFGIKPESLARKLQRGGVNSPGKDG